MRSVILCLGAVMAVGVPAAAQGTPSKAEAKRAEVLVLGVYHMANPGRDIFNMHVDDVLAPKRQQEIAELAAVLKKFQPTKIAVVTAISSRAARSSSRLCYSTQPCNRMAA